MSRRTAVIGRRSVLVAMVAATGCGLTRETEVLAGLVGDYQVRLDSLTDITYVPEVRAWVVRVTNDAKQRLLDSDDATLQDAADNGYVVLFQKCPHLGCRVPDCGDSGLFECPCCGSKYTRYGEYLEGPAPRGLDRLESSISGDDLVIRRTAITPGLPVGIRPSGEDAMGPSCVGVAHDA